MGLEITPWTLENASRQVQSLSEDFHDTAKVPMLHADDVVRAMPGCALAGALQDADQVSIDAKNVMSSRYNWIAHLLHETAGTFRDNDTGLADSLGRMSDLNAARA